MSEAQYDTIAKEYQNSKQLPFRIYAESPTLLQLLGDVSGKNVLDLACGEGIYARKLKKLGADSVVGVDISAEMISLAQEKEKQESLGIDFRVHDAGDLGSIGEFDVVLASYLLNYAKTPEQLESFCRTIHLNLKDRGRVVGMNDNPANDPAHYPLYKPYGFTKSSSQPREEGATVTYTFYQENGDTFHFNNFYLHPSTYERAFRSCGFTSFQWLKPRITEDGLQRFGHSYWQLFQKDPPVIGFEAQK